MVRVYAVSIVCVIIGALFLVGWALGVQITQFQVVVATFLILAVVAIGVSIWGIKLLGLFKRKHISTEEMSKIEDRAIAWWKEKYGEDISKADMASTQRNLGGKEDYIGIVAYRKPYGSNANRPITMVCGTSPFRVVDKQPSPNHILLANPFHFFSAGYQGAPNQFADPSRDAGFYRYKMGGKQPGMQFNINPKEAGMQEFLSGKKPKPEEE